MNLQRIKEHWDRAQGGKNMPSLYNKHSALNIKWRTRLHAKAEEIFEKRCFTMEEARTLEDAGYWANQENDMNTFDLNTWLDAEYEKRETRRDMYSYTTFRDKHQMDIVNSKAIRDAKKANQQGSLGIELKTL